MSYDDLLQLLQSSKILSLWRVQEEEERFVFQFTVVNEKDRGLLTDEFYACVQEHQVDLKIRLQFSHVSVCMFPRPHEPSWRYEQICTPWFDGDAEMHICPVCAEMRKAAGQIPLEEWSYPITTIDLAQ